MSEIDPETAGQEEPAPFEMSSDESDLNNEHTQRRRNTDRRRGWGNCTECPLRNPTWHCLGHSGVVELNSAAHAALEKSNRLGTLKLSAVLGIALAAYGSLFAMVYNNGQILSRVVTRQERVLDQLAEWGLTGTPGVRERLAKLEAKLDTLRDALYDRDDGRH